MKHFSLFLVKKALKSRLNVIIVVLLTIVISIAFYMNSRTAQSLSLENQLQSRIVENEQMIKENEDKLSQTTDTESEEYQFTKKNLELKQNQLEERKHILSLLEQQKWEEAYYLQAKYEEKIFGIISKEAHSSAELKQAVYREWKVYEALSPLNIKAHLLDFPTYGIDQVVWTLTIIIPTLFLISIIFMLTQLFTDRFKDNLDTAKLLPFSKVKFAISSLGVGIGYVSIVFLLICAISLFLGLFNQGLGTLEYPYPIFDVAKQEIVIVKIQNILLESLALEFLVFIVIVEVVYLISFFFKQKTVALFISLISIGGLVFGINVIEPLQRVAHIIPFTYLRSVEVLTGRLPQNIQNAQLSGSMGLTIMPIIMIILFICILLLEKMNGLSIKNFSNK
ncbi:ABC-2 transporter family protein [uncultured Granulicatella sp.]|uniref:ABC-2 transporter family protein n=1 Tax=uncultured Granulicatella sp. TaxID=316089 RepID=UPI0028D8F8C5|nr:ABC-2 transporter family protein [uncultured Granulicatella sp.]